MKTRVKIMTLLVAGLGLVFAPGCGDDDEESNNANNVNNVNNVNNTNNTNNTNNVNNTNNTNNVNNTNNTNNMTDPDPTCENYCATVMDNCTGDQAQYASETECLDYCNNVGNWDTGMKGETSGNTIACRVYHGNAPASADPATHCVHAGPTGGDMCGSWCDNYCNLALANCTDANSLYADLATCETACAGFAADGNAGDTEYDTVQCRIYHAGAPAAGDPGTHCPHAGEEPTDFCVLTPETFRFNASAPGDYTRVDRMGMPAISTAVISTLTTTDVKNDYNDADPADDAAGDFVTEITNNVDAYHTALDAQLTDPALGLVPCATADCVSQAAPLIVPDTLKIDPSTAAGFPNGRTLPDPVIDVTLAVVLLDLSATGQTVTSLVGALNPDENDLGNEGAFLTGFPYLHPPHEP